MPRARASKAELIQRRKEIQELILQGHNSTYIINVMSDKWKTSKRAVEEDITKIGQDWAKRSPEETQKMRNQHLDRLEMMFNEAWTDRNFKVALEIQKEIHKISGLHSDKSDSNADMDQSPQFINIGKRDLKVVNES